MPKVTGPLFSLTASGAFAKTLVYDIRGFVRRYTSPSDPRTAAQLEQRRRFKIAWAGIVRVTNPAAQQLILSSTSRGIFYNWRHEALRQILAAWNSSETEIANFGASEHSAMTNAAIAMGINDVTYNGVTTDRAYVTYYLFNGLAYQNSVAFNLPYPVAPVTDATGWVTALTI